ncbi:MAG: glycosyltransferase family 39 protein [Caldilineaceae bacterium]|nr:glycosyltransferase family 39 protein [Caldilineaceae bacterium]
MILFAIIGIAVFLRVSAAFYLGDATPPAKDETSYSTLAFRLAEGNGFSFSQAWYPFTLPDVHTAHWSFFFTLYVAAVYRLVGLHPLAVRLLTAVIGGALLPVVVYVLSSRFYAANSRSALKTDRVVISRQAVTPLVAAFLAAIYAYFILFSAQLMTETFFIIALLWSLERTIALSQKIDRDFRFQDAFWLGIAFGLATLLRQSILPWIVAVLVWLLWVGLRKRVFKPTFLAALVIVALVALFILPFSLLNYRAYGDFLLLNSNAGYAMYSAQHPMHGTSFQAYAAAPLPADLDPIPQNEAQWDRTLMRLGIQFVLDEPIRYLRLSLSRIADYFEFWPTSDSGLIFNLGRLLSFTLFLPFMVAGIGLALRENQQLSQRRWLDFTMTPLALLLIFIFFYSLLHILTWAMTRYRLPVDAVLLIFAARSLVLLSSYTAKRVVNASFHRK